jgi:hypothetical protein
VKPKLALRQREKVRTNFMSTLEKYTRIAEEVVRRNGDKLGESILLCCFVTGGSRVKISLNAKDETNFLV